MATTVTAQSVSPHSILLGVAGSGGNVATTRTSLLGFFATRGQPNGPLKEELARTPDWTVYNLGGAKCGRVTVREIINRPGVGLSGQAENFKFYWTANGFNADCDQATQVEIRLTHSSRR